MCGISGIYNFGSGASVDSGLIKKMCSVMAHRGPDDEGIYCEGNIGLGHRRLSIIDLSGGHQPMANEDGSIWIVFNGEIYNFIELKEELLRKSHTFKTHSDTETIIHLYEEEGEACVHKLRGMFAFAIWDGRKKKLLLVRERIGKKPLHYAVLDGKLIFASEIKAILQDPSVKRSINYEALHDYLSFLYVPAPKTMFNGIKKLPAGHYLTCDKDGVRITKYWDLDFSRTAHSSEETLAGELYFRMKDAVKMRLISDVPLGAFLSGGVDSSSVVSLMSELQDGPVITNSIGFSAKAYDELKYASAVAKLYSTDHHEYVVEPEALDVLDKLIWHYDEPFGDASSIPTYYVSKMARQNVTVALSGDGGDENFAGYNRYMFSDAVVRLQNMLPGFMKSLMKGAAAFDPFGLYFNIISIYKEEEKARLYGTALREKAAGYRSSDHFRRIFDSCPSRDYMSKLQYLDIKTYLCDDILAKVDRASMAVSLEVRAPILDHKLMEFAATIPSGMKARGLKGKCILKEAMAKNVPPEILNRAKMGFGVPIARWMRADLKAAVEAELFAQDGIISELFDREYVAKMWETAQTASLQGFRKTDFSYRIWVLFIFSRWFKRFIVSTP